MHVHFYEGQQKKTSTVLSSLLLYSMFNFVSALFFQNYLSHLAPPSTSLSHFLLESMKTFIYPTIFPSSSHPPSQTCLFPVCLCLTYGLCHDGVYIRPDWMIYTLWRGSRGCWGGGGEGGGGGGGDGWGQWEADNEMLNGLRRKGKIERDEWFEEIDITLFDWKMEGFI